MGGIFQDGAGVVAPGMLRQHGEPVDDADDLMIGDERQRAPHVRVGNRVEIPIEAHVRLLPRADRPDERRLERMLGARQEARLLLGEHRGDGAIALVGMRPSRWSGCGR